MNSFEAFVIGAAIGLAYCAALWFAVERFGRRSTRTALLWLALTSLSRLALVGAAFFALTMLGPRIALWALIGFGTARLGTTVCKTCSPNPQLPIPDHSPLTRNH